MLSERNIGRKEGLIAAIMIIKDADSLEEAKEEIEAHLIELRTACEQCGSFEIEMDEEGILRCNTCGYAVYEEDRENDEN